MIALLYGRAVTPFVERTLFDICEAAQELGGEIRPLTIEMATANPTLRGDVRRLYIFPFDPPPSARVAPEPAAMGRFVKHLFPRVEIVNSLASQELCWDKLVTQQRLVNRGVTVPDTLVTSEPSEVLEFVREHGFAVLKEREACGGQGSIVLWLEDGRLVGDSGSHQYDVDLVADGERRLIDTRFVYPAPFYVQRLIADNMRGDLAPGQLLRAYIVDGQIAFWTERYRDHYRRPSDFLINAARGAKYRFVLNVSEEAKKLALRAAEVVDVRVAAVDILRSIGGLYVLEVDSDGYHMMIDRQFKHIPEYRDFFNLDRYVAETLLAETTVPVRRLASDEHSTEERRPRDTSRRPESSTERPRRPPPRKGPPPRRD